ncbi:hypothetical protein BO82DRAFT_409643 [Aspergillus uvarum CBS 121591]|uniref:Apple domain-containing protein n=1 Tax=Aspergillus uvarum CBS 121591 TaxID=1448315 RepID=A0A319CMX4_9EURO|nr:hypothetical protein BO82DRAFT_409643 [Aspergillus uvarum CBS 121591]PYH84417.1 hypothetical protein BO82DRAFT_409643 [Aspergillus uvarum CBS 121591]
MKVSLFFSILPLPLLVVGQTTSQQNFDVLCPAGNLDTTVGTTMLNGEQYTYYCNHRATTNDMSNRKSGIAAPATCATYASAADIGVTWLRSGTCATASKGPPHPEPRAIFFEKIVTPPPPDSFCCVERDDLEKERDELQTQLDACVIARDKFEADLATCKASSGGSGGSGGGGGQVSDCRGVTNPITISNTHQSGSQWAVSCNYVSGQGLLSKPGITVTGLPACVDECAKVASCKVAQVLPQVRNNCLLYSAYKIPTTATGSHFAVRS